MESPLSISAVMTVDQCYRLAKEEHFPDIGLSVEMRSSDRSEASKFFSTSLLDSLLESVGLSVPTSYRFAILTKKVAMIDFVCSLGWWRAVRPWLEKWSSEQVAKSDQKLRIQNMFAMPLEVDSAQVGQELLAVLARSLDILNWSHCLNVSNISDSKVLDSIEKGKQRSQSSQVLAAVQCLRGVARDIWIREEEKAYGTVHEESRATPAGDNKRQEEFRDFEERMDKKFEALFERVREMLSPVNVESERAGQARDREFTTPSPTAKRVRILPPKPVQLEIESDDEGVGKNAPVKGDDAHAFLGSLQRALASYRGNIFLRVCEIVRRIVYLLLDSTL